MLRTEMIRPLHVLLEGHARTRGEATAFADEVRGISYGELVRTTARLAGHLAALGVGAGDRVAMVMANAVETRRPTSPCPGPVPSRCASTRTPGPRSSSTCSATAARAWSSPTPPTPTSSPACVPPDVPVVLVGGTAHRWPSSTPS